MPSNGITVRTPKVYEAAKIADLIKTFSKNNLMLERSVENVISNIRNFLIAVEGGEIIGCCAISFFSTDLAEIRSVAVDEKRQKMGIGKILIENAEKILKDEEVKKSFVLTRSPEFFKKIGYSEVSKNQFPQKIWRDCTSCPFLMECDEIAMEKILIE
ncbi:MAG: GNAT family N-acetyltransferase [Spirochaetes bacterium GWF1_51_8]|nr:MAG: GNAT family N-acetyltransferase [Spirochaetes bacterium GWF1_51_8]